ncbi:MAG: adenosine kinase [Candidatus Latescibacterota bacterium]
MERTYDVYGVGHALVDVQYAVAPEFLPRHGLAKGLMTLIDAERQAEVVRRLGQPPIARASGGSAANTLIGVAGFGGRAYYACLLGQDEWGDFYQEDLARAGVHSSPSNRAPGRTGQCLILITPDADRTMHTFLGASSGMGPEQIEEGVLAASQYAYLEGYLLSAEAGLAACRRAQELAHRHGVRVALTLSDPSVVTACAPRFAQVVDGGVDLLFCNEDEARAIAGGADTPSAVEHVARLAARACITCGARGAVLCEAGSCTQVPAVPVRALDTTGAGDLFAGGVLYGVTHGYPLLDAGRLGSYAAAQVVAQYGPRLGRSLADQVGAILAHST